MTCFSCSLDTIFNSSPGVAVAVAAARRTYETGEKDVASPTRCEVAEEF